MACESEPSFEELKTVVCGERGARDHRRLHAPEEIVAQHRSEIKRNTVHREIAFRHAGLPLKLHPPNHRGAICRWHETSHQRIPRTLQATRDTANLPDGRGQLLGAGLIALESQLDFGQSLADRVDFGEQFPERIVDAAAPEHMLLKCLGEAQHRDALLLQHRRKEFEQQLRAITCRQHAREQSLPHQVHACDTEQVAAPRQLRCQRGQ